MEKGKNVKKKEIGRKKCASGMRTCLSFQNKKSAYCPKMQKRRATGDSKMRVDARSATYYPHLPIPQRLYKKE